MHVRQHGHIILSNVLKSSTEYVTALIVIVCCQDKVSSPFHHVCSVCCHGANWNQCYYVKTSRFHILSAISHDYIVYFIVYELKAFAF